MRLVIINTHGPTYIQQELAFLAVLYWHVIPAMFRRDKTETTYPE
jgi:hypothetical protein